MGLKYLASYNVSRCAITQALLFCLYSIARIDFFPFSQSSLLLGIVLNDPNIFWMVNEQWLKLEVARCVAPNKSVSLFFEARHIDFSSLAMNILDDLLTESCFIYTENLLLIVIIIMNYLRSSE